MLLTGTFLRSLDEKLRLAVPKRLREAMGCGEGATLYIAPGTDGSLSIYPEEAFRQLAKRIEAVSPAEQHVRAFTRLFYARAQRVELDSQGRLRIPVELARLGQLEGDVVLLGVQNHVELWAQERWQAYLAEKEARYDDIAEAALGNSGQ